MAVMMTPRESWTDQRLSDLDKKVDEGFARTDRDIRELRGEMNAGFARLDQKIDRLTLGLLVSVIGIIATMLSTGTF